MSDVFLQSLQITALGMGLVFAAILVLWLMMVILTTLTADKEPKASPVSPSTLQGTEARDKVRAAAVAVAIALAEQETSSAHPLPEPPTAIVSAWQLGMRTRLLAQKGNTRKRK